MKKHEEKKHYSDQGGENVVHMYTPFSLAVGDNYDYLRTKPWQAFRTAALHAVVVVLLRPFFFLNCGMIIRGKEKPKHLKGTGFVAVLNHVNVMDAPMAACALGFRRIYYVSAASNFCIPVIRHLIRGCGAVPLTSEASQVIRLFDEMEKALKAGAIVQMYPEGVLIPYSDELRPFKRGAFLMASQADVPVLPLVISYRRPRGLWRWLKKKPCLTLSVLEPVIPDSTLPLRDRTQKLQSDCRTAMEQQLQKSMTEQ